MKKPLPEIKTKKAFDKFISNTDLGDYLEENDLVSLPLHFKKQDKVISLRVSNELLQLIKKAANKHKVKYQKLIKSILEENLSYYLK